MRRHSQVKRSGEDYLFFPLEGKPWGLLQIHALFCSSSLKVTHGCCQSSCVCTESWNFPFLLLLHLNQRQDGVVNDFACG